MFLTVEALLVLSDSIADQIRYWQINQLKNNENNLKIESEVLLHNQIYNIGWLLLKYSNLVL
jgi:hypothetical protein